MAGPDSPARKGPDFGLLRGHGYVVRFAALFIGVFLYGVSSGLMLQAELGNMPWDVLHQGLSHHVPLTTGQIAVVLSLGVLCLWIPLRQRPGIGTFINAVGVGLSIDLTTHLVPTPDALWGQILMALSGIVLNGFATVLYIAPSFGPGPRDGLMTGLVTLTGWPVLLVRSSIEIVVMAVGWLLGGNLFIASIAFAVGIGAVTHVFLVLASKVITPRVPRRRV